MKKSIFLSCIVFLSGCGIFETEDNSTIKFGTIKNQVLNNGTISIVAIDNSEIWNSSGKIDTNYTNGSYSWESKKHSTSTNGNIVVLFEIKNDENSIISKGEISIPLKQDWAWSVDVHHSNMNPMLACFGCFGSKSFPILDSAYIINDTDSIFIVYGGNSISHPVIY